jgi:hypothetical protein
MSNSTNYAVDFLQFQETARLRHIQALPNYLEIAMIVAEKVFNRVSLDRLESLQLCEIGELVDNPDPMLKLVWVAKWRDGHSTKFPVVIPEPYAVKHPSEIGVSLEHRLMREVFREDTILSL